MMEEYTPPAGEPQPPPLPPHNPADQSSATTQEEGQQQQTTTSTNEEVTPAVIVATTTEATPPPATAAESAPATAPATPVPTVSTTKILREGWMTKIGNWNRTWNKRWFELTEFDVIYYKDQSKKEKKGTIHLSTITSVSEFAESPSYPGRKNMFLINTTSRNFLIEVEDASQSEWITLVQQQCAKVPKQPDRSLDVKLREVERKIAKKLNKKSKKSRRLLLMLLTQ